MLGIGTDFESGNNEVTQDTAWYERQLLDTQFVGEMEFGELGVDLRAGYAQTQREAPWEYSFEYFENPEESNPFRGLYQNTLDEQRSRARVTFSDLTEDLYYGGIDLSYPVLDWASVTVGYAYSLTERYSSRREFSFRSSNFPAAFSLFQPAHLLSDAIIDFGEHPENPSPYQLQVFELTQATPAFLADLEIHAGYGQLRLEPVDGLTFDLGVRYEDATQTVEPDTSVFNDPQDIGASTALANDYFLPGGTVTYDFGNDLQARLSASRTVARPQFREMIFQPYQDPEANRLYRGNPLLTDSELTNLEARLEYYLGRGSRAMVAGFYKDIEGPIETFQTLQDGRVNTSFANAPPAQLYADCIEQAARSNTYGRAADGDTEMVRFNCTGQPAQAFWTALDAWSLEQDSRWERDGWSYRSTTRVEQNLFGVDFCASDGAGYQCVIHLNVGEFATPR